MSIIIDEAQQNYSDDILWDHSWNLHWERCKTWSANCVPFTLLTTYLRQLQSQSRIVFLCWKEHTPNPQRLAFSTVKLGTDLSSKCSTARRFRSVTLMKGHTCVNGKTDKWSSRGNSGHPRFHWPRILPLTCICSERSSSGPGRVDIFIPIAKWGTQMIFECDRLNERCRRVQPGWAYPDRIKPQKCMTGWS